jgi:hypothetical protein
VGFCQLATNMAHLLKAANYLQMMLLLALLQMAVTRPSNFEEFGSQPHEDKCKEGHVSCIYKI